MAPDPVKSTPKSASAVSERATLFPGVMTCQLPPVHMKVIFAFVFLRHSPISEGHGLSGRYKALAKQKTSSSCSFPPKQLPTRLGYPPVTLSYGLAQETI